MDTTQEKGRQLERAAHLYLLEQQEVDDVYTWRDWAHKQEISANDIGVDLVAIRDGQPWAVQCKHWAREVSWNDLGTFIGTLNDVSLGFAGGYLIAGGISRTAADRLANSAKPVVVIPAAHLADYLDLPAGPRPPSAPHTLRPYQTEAVTHALQGLDQHGRGKLIMAPGTGKTTVAAHIATRMGKGALILFCCPTIALLDQSIRAFRRDCPDLHACAVVSDAAVGREEDGLSVLAFPATTKAEDLLSFTPRADKINVVFATYQSLAVIAQAQRKDFPEFDLAICDEAHRTAGVSTAEDDAFRLIHDNQKIRARRRLYMTATPRVFDVREEQRKVLDEDLTIRLYDMSDEAVYGPTLYEYGMRRAINDGYLSPYRLVVIAVDRTAVQEQLREYLASEGAHSLDDTTKLIGLAHLVSGRVTDERGESITVRAKRGIVFLNRVSRAEKVAKDFAGICRSTTGVSNLDIRHIDGRMSAWEKRALIDWLAEQGEEVRILANAKVLGEGIDVPALDFIAFLDPRESVIEVIQAVGRVVRRAEGKTHGLIFVPLVISGDQSLDDVFEGGPYKTLWRVLNALAAVDDGFLSRLRLKMLRGQAQAEAGDEDAGDEVIVVAPPSIKTELLEQLREHLRLKVVRSLRLGREFLLDWAAETAQLAQALKREVVAAVQKDAQMQSAFAELKEALRAFLREDASDQDAIDLIVQYVLIHPIFDAIFERRGAIDELLHQFFGRFKSFLANNAPALPGFYARARERAAGLRDEAERQEFLRHVYTHFLSVAFRETAEALGIAFTPLALVEFVVRFADRLTRTHFGRGLEDEGVVILDPFAGVGTFIAMAAAIMDGEKLKGKLARGEVWANEILLLPYMAAAKNIESTIARLTGDAQAEFSAALWSDSFRVMEYYYGQAQPQLPEVVPPLYRAHIAAQLAARVNVILTNPPWRGGRKSENEANPNAVYPNLRRRIAETYARPAPYMPRLLSALYNTSIQALRMASDRLREGVIGFVMDNGWLKSSSGRGVRQALREEFDEVYVYDLRGDARTSGETRKQEGENVFGEQSRSGVCILMAVRRTSSGSHQGRIYYRTVPDYADLETKFGQLKADAENPDRIPWQTLTPDRQHDWLAQGREGYETLVGLDEIFGLETFGLKSHRDRYAWNFSADELGAHMKRLIGAYNDHVARLPEMGTDLEGWIERDPRVIKWDRSLKQKLLQKVRGEFLAARIYPGLYRPFVPMFAYFDAVFNAQTGKLAQVFPDAQARTPCIVVSGPSTKGVFSALCCDRLPDYGLLGSTLVYPLYRYAEKSALLALPPELNISQAVLDRFRSALGDGDIGAEDLFYYALGVLSTPSYRQEYANDLARERPRIPIHPAFRGIARAGRALAELQMGFERLAPLDLELEGDPNAPLQRARYDRAEDCVVVNGCWKLSGFPPEAVRYRVGAYHPVEWLARYLPPSDDEETGIAWNARMTVGDFARRAGQVAAMALHAATLLDELNALWRS